MTSFFYKQAERFVYLLLLLSLAFGWIVIKILIQLAPLRRKRKPTKDFLFFPYLYKDNIGTLARVQEYLPFLDRDRYTYDVHYPTTRKKYHDIYFTKLSSRAKEYWFYNRLFWQRFLWILKAPNYKAIYFQRALFPNYYNQRRAILEQLLRVYQDNITVDYFDADYARNEIFYLNVIRNCDKVSVVNKFLHDYFIQHHPKVLFNELSLDAQRYKIKSDYTLHQPIKIFWTGSHVNAVSNLNSVLKVLNEVNLMYPLKLVMVCSSNEGFDQPFIEHHLWRPETFFDLLANSDIAIYPVAEDNEFSRGKVAYKTLEYMASKVPMIASPQGLSSHLKDNEDVLIANNTEEWKQQLVRMLNDEQLRKRLSSSAYEKFIKFHEVNVTYKNLLAILNV